MDIALKQILGFLVPLIYLQCEKSKEAVGSLLWEGCCVAVKRRSLYLDVLFRDGLNCPVSEQVAGKGGAFDFWHLRAPANGHGSHAVNALRLKRLANAHSGYHCSLPICEDNLFHHSGRSIWSSFSNKSAPRVPSDGGGGGFTASFRDVLSSSGLGLLIHDRVEPVVGGDIQLSQGPRVTMFVDEETFIRVLGILYAIKPDMPMPNAVWSGFWADAKLLMQPRL